MVWVAGGRVTSTPCHEHVRHRKKMSGVRLSRTIETTAFVGCKETPRVKCSRRNVCIMLWSWQHSRCRCIHLLVLKGLFYEAIHHVCSTLSVYYDHQRKRCTAPCPGPHSGWRGHRSLLVQEVCYERPYCPSDGCVLCSLMQ